MVYSECLSQYIKSTFPLSTDPSYYDPVYESSEGDLFMDIGDFTWDIMISFKL